MDKQLVVVDVQELGLIQDMIIAQLSYVEEAVAGVPWSLINKHLNYHAINVTEASAMLDQLVQRTVIEEVQYERK